MMEKLYTVNKNVQERSLGKTVKSLLCFILYSKAKPACYSRYLLTSYFCISVPYNEKDIFFGC